MNFSIRKLLITAMLSIVMSAPVFAGRLIVVDDNTGNFYEVDTSVPSAALLGNAVTSLSLTGLGYDSTNGVMYVSDTCGPACFGLGSVDTTTWEVTEIGGFVSTSNIHALAHDSTRDILFGWDVEDDQLVTLNRATGEESYIGSPGSLDIRGMAYDPATDTLFGADNSNLYSIDSGTGVGTLIGAFGVSISSSIGLDFDSETGRMFVGDSSGDIYEVDPIAGAAVLLGNLGFVIDGMASITGTPTPIDPAVSVPIPATSPLGLLLMALLLIGLAWRRTRVTA